MRMTEEEYQVYLNKRGLAKKKSKFNNIKTEVDGIRFDSKREAEYYKGLKLLERAGEVTKIELQPRYELQPTFRKDGVTHRPIAYVADFKVTYKDKRVEIIDVKASKTFQTQVYRIKKKLFEYKYPDLTIKEVY